MDKKFWTERWEKGETGWHRDEVHPELVAHWPSLGLAPKSRVLVPLCGATPDMHWLAQQGHEVIGVELSKLAIERFLARHRVRHIETEDYGFHCYMGGRYQMLCGDFFALPDEVFASVDAIYDRASLVALPADLRARYASLLGEKLKPGTRGLLLSLDYDQSQMSGPPFSVPPDAVAELIGPAFDIETLTASDALDDGMRKRGLSALRETAYRLTRKGAA